MDRQVSGSGACKAHHSGEGACMDRQVCISPAGPYGLGETDGAVGILVMINNLF